MNTPTPRTDAFAIIASPSRNQYLDFAEQLERELTTVTEQRDRLAEELKETKKHLKDANRGAEINAHALRINADKLAAVTEQRDRLAEDLNKMISICSCETEDIDTVNEIRYFVDTITKHSNP